MTRDLTLTARDEAATARIAAALAPHLRAGDVVLLDGALAAGKTFFVRALVAALGCTEQVTSPTYTIAHIYETGSLPVLHVDAYRLRGAQDFHHLGLEEQVESGLSLIEWGERLGDFFDAPLSIRLDFGAGEGTRRITLRAEAARWSPVLDALEGVA
ncbi:tRNA (adenosine(37)-N6)-threonylcarbamoyltransferase complex ATPase subunit type 1 TsaE [Celeribacter indicus]|uniref:tRNA threonylcarbamoyladenosine biosynthesis protein TsaE n=1 Tax=Celeribacter indicus TaxID=1208324 RepID=A0A0B5DT38_9RHOB|nr:tRNA (adenosine(37)-N6)-threonylcarbamoyltransferase complex ATPase subunit type 1 TsaE [Celeribacter indicus]AJE46204.1 hypothetical protein P73_1489 [Celeribacter indicus]SDW49915.1 tRNA threonylcarbamoyladenosine biosynthesis protein TsaE [Celeribacter indicus]